MNNIYDLLNDAKDYTGNIERVELTDIEKEKFMKKLMRKKYKKNSTGKMSVAAACAAVLIVGTSAYAAVKKMGIIDYFAGKNANIPQEQVERLVDTNVQQETPEQKEDSLVDFHIREALCDNNQLVVEVQAVPVDPEHYILAPTDAGLDMPVTDLGIEGVTEGTVGEYADAQGKEVLLVGAGVEDDSIVENSMDFIREPDGTMVIVVTSANVIKENIMNLTCHATYINAKDSGMEDVVHDVFAFQLTDQSTTEQAVYVADEDVILDDVAGSAFDELLVSKTELTLALTLKTHATKELSEKDKWEKYDTDYRFFTEDGRELNFLRSGGGAGEWQWQDDGTWKETGIYEVMDLSDTLVIKAYAIGSGREVEYGTITVRLKK